MSKTLTIDYPRKFRKNIEFRANLLEKAENDKVLQSQIKEVCRRDIITFIDLFCWTKNPKDLKCPIKPFICYEEYQVDYIRDIQEAVNGQYDVLTEKSRELGITWAILYVFLHQWLFINGADFKVGNWKEDFVDKLGDIDTHFEKLRFTLRKLPIWLLPEGFVFKNHATYCRLFNPESGNTIIGETANENFGSGGRRKAMFLDEFAKWDNRKADGAWTATADITKCRVVTSTPVGSANKFAQLASGQHEKIKKITLHWTLHPEKAKDVYYLDGQGNKIPFKSHHTAFEYWLKKRHKSAPEGLKGGIVRSPWYDEECDRRKITDIAQELDIDYARSGAPFFDIEALLRQYVWQYTIFGKPFDSIPFGKFARGILADLDHKIEFREVQGGWLKLFEFPRSDYQYVVSGDTSEGLPKGDESYGVVREKWTRNVVATFNGLYEPDDMAVKMNIVSKFFNNALVGPENNNHGYTTCLELQKMDSNLYRSKTRRSDGSVVSDKRGFTTTPKTRPIMLDQAEEEIRKAAVEVRDPDIINQMKTFVRSEKTGKPEADGDMLDDGVMAFAIAGQMITEHPFKLRESKKKEQQKRIVYEAKKRKNGGFSFKTR